MLDSIRDLSFAPPPRVRRHLVLCTLLAAFLLPGAHAEGEGAPRVKEHWVLVYERAGIRVWQLEGPDRERPRLRASALVPGDFATVLEVLRDARRFHEWVPRCRSSRLVRAPRAVEGGVELVSYQRFHVPWPAWDRDVVLKDRAQVNAELTRAAVDFEETKGFVPIPKRVVRMPRTRGRYLLLRKGPNLTQLTYDVDTDVGGRLPRWLVRWVAKKAPAEAIDGLRQQVRRVLEERGKHARP